MSDRAAILRRATPIFHEVLRPDLAVTETLDASQVEEWDSLNHISLIVALENEFGCEFTTDELAAMENVGDLVSTLEAKGV
jgi:acyl carrier protein